MKTIHQITLALAWVLSTLAGAPLVQAQSTPEVRIDAGMLEGIRERDMQVFRGIPYARPPVGDLRWQPPLPVAAWEGTRKATAFGPACMQGPRPGIGETSEDCLTLNVFTPADARPGANLPVMVWVHGGGFTGGSGAGFDGAAFTRDGVILVTFNYRLGLFGIFAHPELEPLDNAQPWANYAVLDMVEVLKWVQHNISEFGGNPGRVTIFGESAGAMGVHLLMTTPSAKNLFHGAIAQSGYGTWPLPRAERASKLPGSPTAEQQTLAAISTIAPGRQLKRQDLKALPAALLANAVSGFLLPVVDGVIIEDEPGIVFAQGRQHKVPYITGANGFDGVVLRGSGVDAKAYWESWSEKADEIRKLYASDFAQSEEQGIARLFGDQRYGYAGHWTADQMSRAGIPTWLYYYDYLPAAQRSELPGAPHGGELAGIFDVPNIGDEQRAMGATIRGYWINFARTGNPNYLGGDGAPWPVFDADDQWMVFRDGAKAQSGVLKDKLALIGQWYLARIGLKR
ncbi:MAG: carboxylesterase family protein [Gammaproteobacteria bacterium]|nr:carboxylesterase family protein [Gammaproteobacteria bacterium]